MKQMLMSLKPLSTVTKKCHHSKSLNGSTTSTAKVNVYKETIGETKANG